MQNSPLFTEIAGMSKNNFTTVRIKTMTLCQLSDENELRKIVRG